jgi:hypothetical protein
MIMALADAPVVEQAAKRTNDKISNDGHAPALQPELFSVDLGPV